MKEHWWRSWHGAPTDPKWLAVARMAGVPAGVVVAVAWALFDHASQAVTRGDASSFDCDAFSAFSGFKEEEIQLVIDAMAERGMINEDGLLVAWERRQPKREDNSTDRTRAWRERNAEKRTVTQGDARGEERREEKKEEDTSLRSDLIESPKAATGKYAFESGVIRLNQKDFDEWTLAFSHLDLRAELLSLSEWAANQPKWFHAVSGALAKRNREQKTKAAAGLGPTRDIDPRKWSARDLGIV